MGSNDPYRPYSSLRLQCNLWAHALKTFKSFRYQISSRKYLGMFGWGRLSRYDCTGSDLFFTCKYCGRDAVILTALLCCVLCFSCAVFYVVLGVFVCSSVMQFVSRMRRFGEVSFFDFMDVDQPESLSQTGGSSSDSSQDQDGEENVLIGSIQGTIVGLRYYTGTVGGIVGKQGDQNQWIIHLHKEGDG